MEKGMLKKTFSGDASSGISPFRILLNIFKKYVFSLDRTFFVVYDIIKRGIQNKIKKAGFNKWNGTNFMIEQRMLSTRQS